MKYGSETLAVAQRILLELWRRRRSLVFWTVFPVAILLLTGMILAEQEKLSLAHAFERAAPATLVGAALFFSCAGGSVATVVAEREQRTLKRLFLSPLSGTSYFLGIFLAHSCIGLGQTFLVYGVATAFGAKFQGSLILGFLIILLSIIAYVGVGFILGTQLARRTEDINALVATFGVPLLILGGSFFPASVFPSSLLSLARFNPIYHMTEALGPIWAEGKTIADIKEHLEFLSIFAVIIVIMGWLCYRRMLRVERRL